MSTIEIILAIIATGAFTTVLNQIFNYKKSKSDNKKAKAEAEGAEVDLDEKLIRHYKIQLTELLIEVQYLREEVKSLKDMLENRDLDDCQNKDCENRKTKRNGK